MVALRKTLLLPLDDLLAITLEFINPDVCRSGRARCLKRHGFPRLKELIPQEEHAQRAVKSYMGYKLGPVHVDINYLPQMLDQTSRSSISLLRLTARRAASISRFCRLKAQHGQNAFWNV